MKGQKFTTVDPNADLTEDMVAAQDAINALYLKCVANPDHAVRAGWIGPIHVEPASIATTPSPVRPDDMGLMNACIRKVLGAKPPYTFEIREVIGDPVIRIIGKVAK